MGSSAELSLSGLPDYQSVLRDGYGAYDSVSSSLVSADASSDGRTALKERKAKITRLVRKLKISGTYEQYMDLLFKYDIVLLVDDSKSLDTRTSFDKPTAWKRLTQTALLVLSASTAYDEDGIDLFAFGRDEQRNVMNERALKAWFKPKPVNAATPLAEKIQDIFNEYSNNEKPVLLLVATDGVPNDGGSEVDGRVIFEDMMRQRERNEVLRDKFAVNFLLCTEESSTVEYFRGVDENYTNVDVSNFYEIEKAEVQRHNADHPFSEGDWLVKMLLGSIVPELDDLDEKKVKHRRGGGDDGCQCTIL